MDLFIITGTTQGLGHSLANICLDEGHLVLSISRTTNFDHENFINIKHDLSKVSGLEKKLITNLNKIDLRKINSIHLINNAATLNPIGNVSEQSFDDINSHMQLNLLTPIFLTSFIMKFYKRKKVFKTFTNISSGAAYNPSHGWALYCSAKSGLKMFTDCMHFESITDLKLKYLDFIPGLMDTKMQATIRKQKTKDFNRVEYFKEIKDKKLLVPPQTVASILFNILKSPADINKNHYDVKEFIQ